MDLRHDYECDKVETDICTCGADDVVWQKSEIARLKAKVDRLHNLTITLSMDRNIPAMRVAEKMHNQQVQATDDYMALLEQLKTARNDALEEAAILADYYADADYCEMGYPEDGGIAASGTAHTIREAIRARKTGDK